MPREIRYCCLKSQPAESLLSFLVAKFTYLSLDAWKVHIAAGHVHVNGAVVTDEEYVLAQGEMLRFAPPRTLEPPVNEDDIEIIYDEDTLLVCVKNGSLPVAEGGRYCENTLIGVLQRRGIHRFHTPRTRYAPKPSFPANDECRKDDLSTCGSLSPTKIDVEIMDLTSLEGPKAIYGKGKRARGTHLPETGLFTVQRLDKETSGLLVLCKDRVTTQRLSHQLEAQTRDCTAAAETHLCTSQTEMSEIDFEAILAAAKAVRKTYTAVLIGAARVGETFLVVNLMGTVSSHPTLAKDPSHAQLGKLKMCCESVRSTGSGSDGSTSPRWGKLACTRVRVLASDAALHLSCVRVDLLTGRSHQIRVHCAEIGYPILGDKLYTTTSPGVRGGGVAVSDALYLDRVRQEEDPFILVEMEGTGEGHRLWCSRHLLHATELAFDHPGRCPALRIECTSSSAPFFTREVRFESGLDGKRFVELLAEASVEEGKQ